MHTSSTFHTSASGPRHRAPADSTSVPLNHEIMSSRRGFATALCALGLLAGCMGAAEPAATARSESERAAARRTPHGRLSAPHLPAPPAPNAACNPGVIRSALPL